MARKKYYEVVFEGKYETIWGMLEGFLLANNEKWEFWFSRKSGIETETFAEAILEWGSLKSRLHHVIMDRDFHRELQKKIGDRDDLQLIRAEYTKSAREIRAASFKFTAKAYAIKYGSEIKEILSKPPAGVTIENYKPSETIIESARGVELYAPEHDYTFTAEGIATGEFRSILDFRKKLGDHPLVEVSLITLHF